MTELRARNVFESAEDARLRSVYLPSFRVLGHP